MSQTAASEAVVKYRLSLASGATGTAAAGAPASKSRQAASALVKTRDAARLEGLHSWTTGLPPSSSKPAERHPLRVHNACHSRMHSLTTEFAALTYRFGM